MDVSISKTDSMYAYAFSGTSCSPSLCPELGGLKSPWLRPLILCGQHSLEIFCLGVFLAFAGHFMLAEVSGGAGMHFVISVSGIIVMSAAAWLFSWYKGVVDKGGTRAKSAGADADLAGGGL